MTLSEPTTALTDYLITASCVVYGFLLIPHGADGRSGWLWPVGMFLLGAAALTGGTFHGFRHALPESTLHSLWDLTLVLIGASAGFMVGGSLAGTIGPARDWLLAGTMITLLGGIVMALRISFHQHFNQNDLFHCMVLVALYFFYRGAGLVQYSHPPA